MRKALALSSITAKELLRGNVFISLLVLYTLTLLLANFFGSVTIGNKTKIIQDFGLFSISFASTLFISIMGTALLHKEITRKTIYTILAKPVSRTEFLLGKFLGIFFATTTIITALALILEIFLFIQTNTFNLSIFLAASFIILESLILSASAIFFSSIVSTPLLGGVFTFALFLAGRSSESLLYFQASQDLSDSIRGVLSALYWVVPHLDALYIGNLTVYGISPSIAFVWQSIVYSIFYAVVLFQLSIIFFRKKEFGV